MKYESCKYCHGTGKQIDQCFLGSSLRKLREKAALTLRAVAKSLGVSAPYLSDLELGRRYWHENKIADYKTAITSLLKENKGKKIIVYGLFNCDGKCEYVGATKRPINRRLCHKRKWKHLKLVELFRCSGSKAANLEMKTIRKFRKKGQCQLNKTINRSFSNSWLS